MEVFLYNSTVCRLCGEENDSGNLLYSSEDNNQSLCDLINTYLPIKVSDDGELPRTICPGCTIQLEATVEFLNLIINGQKVIRELHQREKEYKKSISNDNEPEVITERIVYEINTSDGVYQVEHPIALQVSGLEKPKRKRGRPPKKPKSPEEIAQELAAREKELAAKKQKAAKQVEVSGKRTRKAPTRYQEAVQGKELERIFKEEGVIDEMDGEAEIKKEAEEVEEKPPPKEPEVIGHLEDSGELVVVVKGKGRGRPKGRMRQTHEACTICGMEFNSVGRYMSHVAQHGPVMYQCTACGLTHPTLIEHQTHQKNEGHEGQLVIPCQAQENKPTTTAEEGDVEIQVVPEQDPLNVPDLVIPEEAKSLPTLDETKEEFIKNLVSGESSSNVSDANNDDKPSTSDNPKETTSETEVVELGPKGKPRLKCNQCDKTFNSKQSKSLHIKAVHQGEKPYVCQECGCKFAYPRSLALHAISHRRNRSSTKRYACDLCGKTVHQGEKPYVCQECGCKFAYPRSLALHAISHRRNRSSTKRYACDLCGKVLNHPSSVVYHKEAEHANQRYVCNTCGKSFKHKQLLQRHQLVHSQVRPYTCKVETCNASFKTKANLINHQLLHSGVKKFSCEICKHKFAHKTSLTLHMRWHTGSKPYGCKVCGKSFSQKGNLSEHERIHSGEKPYQCTVCPRKFTTSSQYRLHARRHQPERPYACSHCPKRFVSRSSWLAHQRREAGVRTHACGVCSRAFAERWALVKHMRKHTGERPFKCPHCPRTFADCSNLNKHKKVSIPDIQSEADEGEEEGVIYVAYDVDDSQSGFTIMDPQQAVNLQENKVLTTCELYSGPSLLVSQAGMELSSLQSLQPLELAALAGNQEQIMLSSDENQLLEQDEEIMLDTETIQVTDAAGNPLHFTMQDGTRLAITSADGKSLQVITQDGQTIPVEINEFAEEEEAEENQVLVPNTVVQQQLQKIDAESEGIRVLMPNTLTIENRVKFY
ncbi:zinc-finger double domain-containing protein [Phthorimaea operculella]|nr:zinc-finger double domain-containing protein [Phthorimaea operculella]